MNFRVNSELKLLRDLVSISMEPFGSLRKKDKMDINRVATGLILSTFGFYFGQLSPNNDPGISC